MAPRRMTKPLPLSSPPKHNPHSKFNAPEKRELLQGAQTSFHVHFSAPPALLRPPSATAAEDDGGGGGGK